MPHLIVCRDPFRPHARRHVEPLRRRTRVDTALRRHGLISGRGRTLRRHHPFVVLVDGQPLLQRDWARPLDGQSTAVVGLLPQGGGGSNPLQAVLQIALIAGSIYAPYLAGLTSTVAGVTTVTRAGMLLSAGVLFGGSLLVNALLPPPAAPAALGREAASPTYTIGSQGNNARLLEAIPVQYGRFRRYPDLAAQPYTENLGNEQYVYQLYCLGQGEFDIEALRIEDTPIASFEEVQYEVVPPGAPVTLFPDNVVTSEAVTGLELLGENEDGYAAKGPFVANPAGSQANWIGVDFAFQGLFLANDAGGLDPMSMTFEVQAQAIDDSGAPVGGWTTLATESIEMATDKAQLISRRYPVGAGRYQVQARRVGDKNLDSRAGNTLTWSGLRAYLPSQSFWPGLTMIATVIRGTNNLNGNTARRVNAVCTRKLPVWDGAMWSAPVATRNPAWAIADALRDPNYGRGLPDKRINVPELLRLAGVWADRGDCCDGVFDTTSTLWDALTQICRVGRAMPMYYAGIIDIVRNEPRTIRTAMFTPTNIVAGSFSIDYAFPDVDTPDHVVVEYTDPETWQPATVPCILTGGTSNTPANVTMWGVVSRDQAWREGMSMAAANRDQRRIVNLTTELEGHIPRYGDLVPVSHDVPAWGLPGIVEWFIADSGIVQVSEPLEWTPAEAHYIAFRGRDGSADGPYPVTPGADEFHAVVGGTLEQRKAIYIADGDREEPTAYMFGPGERNGLDCLMLAATPADGGQVQVKLTNYAASVHEAETGGAAPPPPPASLLPGVTAAPVVASVSVSPGATNGQQIIAAAAARGAVRYEFQASTDGERWTPLGDSTSTSIIVSLAAGDWQVRARAIGAMPGPWAYWTGTVSAVTMVPPTPSLSLQDPWTGKSLRINVNNARGDFRTIQVSTGGVLRREYSTTNYVIDWSIDDAIAYGAVGASVTISVVEVNAAGSSGIATLTPSIDPPAPPEGEVVRIPDGESSILVMRLTWSTSPAASVHHIFSEISDEWPGIDWTGTPNGEPSIDVPLPPGGDYKPYEIWCEDVWGNESTHVDVQQEMPPDPGG